MTVSLEETRNDLSMAVADCLVSVGLISSIIEHFPDEVQDNFEEKISELVVVLRREIDEFTEFGSALDGYVDN